jgi:hypothetical protein
VPQLATQAHQEAIDQVVDEALQRAGVQPEQLSAVAVTVGPGLALCLRVGALKVRPVQLGTRWRNWCWESTGDSCCRTAWLCHSPQWKY